MMIVSTKGIVLNHIKYKESSIIVNVYTQHFGRQSYVVNRVRSTKNKGNTVLLQPLSLIEMQVYHRPKADLQRIKEFKLLHPLTSIPFDQTKRAIAFFLTEVMSKVLREEEANDDLFRFIYHGIEVFDTGVDGVYNFHLFFLFHLSRFLGFGPGANDENDKVFDLLNGRFVSYEPTHGYFIKDQLLDRWKDLFQLNINELSRLKMSAEVRSQLLEILIRYYELHLDGLGSIKSFEVLQALFHGEG
ncbi:DNA repair protein RecO [Carboxylicivirga caseinilyticus]|uniref:DNA repair protein RecO n=1 Tax=Carboxylicivirga caseinilyticus TaxID=3417572 RepID=UPI003D33FDCD|nr:DNA repair protein RecO [Marinilabiliaceae bacterium A049]